VNPYEPPQGDIEPHKREAPKRRAPLLRIFFFVLLLVNVFVALIVMLVRRLRE
jgi:uncharacterized membrane protein YhaH (DUF805 family)